MMEHKEGTQNRHDPLELHKVLDLLAAEASCADSRDHIASIEPVTILEEAERLQAETEEAHRLIAQFGSPSLYGIRPVADALNRAKADGVLSMGELLLVAEALRTIRSFFQYGQTISGEGAISYLFHSLRPQKSLEDRIFGAIRSPEEMEDRASSSLFDLRRKIRSTESRVREELDSLIRSPHYQKALQDTIITRRDNRYVIPVKLEHRGDVPGLVHDTSGSGATLFIEPMRVVELNNDVAVLKSKEQEEIHRILAVFSAEVKEFAKDIARGYEVIIQLDVLFAKARLGYSMKAVRPKLNGEGRIRLFGARHPLIDQDQVVPIRVDLGVDYTTLVVTGPNTGGKTVALKTIGLLALMAACGLMVPADEETEIAVFDAVFPDIGDEQSIEQSLSTFSSHMSNLIHILGACSKNSLVLLDELGAGTDPEEGAALAVSILEHLRLHGVLVAATTHYSELKVYALDTLGVENASCDFNLETLSPTYRLLVGVPGKSNAFAISQKLGLSSEIISAAKVFLSEDQTRMEGIVSTLNEQRKQLEEERQKAREAYLEAEKLRMAAKNRDRGLEEARQKILDQAKEEAARIVERVQVDANRVLDDLTTARRRIKDEQIQQELSERKASLTKEVNQMRKKGEMVSFEKEGKQYEPPRPFEKGDSVEVVPFSKAGTILSISGDQAMVQMERIKTKVRISDLRLLKKQKTKVVKQPKHHFAASVGGKGNRSGSREVDVRGKTVEEALTEIDQFLDDAVLSHTSTLTIIHGKGTGALRGAVQTHLRQCRDVRAFRLGTFGEGEDGVTIVEMK